MLRILVASRSMENGLATMSMPSSRRSWRSAALLLQISASGLKPLILVRELRPVAKLPQGLRVGQRVGVFHRFAMHHIAHRQFDDLAADGARDIADGEDFCRHMPWRGVGADHLADLLFEGVIQLDAIVEPHE